MTISDVRANLADLLVGRVAGRRSSDEILIFDSTGLAFQDVAAASVVYERGVQSGVGVAFSFVS
jgi:alanine dehydrogenase